MRAALYARYSSDRQNERSIDDQLAVCRRHAEGRGWSVVATFADAAISGSAMANRPGLQTLLAAAGGGAFDVVLVEDEDRLARNLEHQANVFNRLKAAGVAIATLASDKIGILEVGLKGVMAELYLVNLSQKTSRGMRANAERGAATGSRLYGYRSSPGGDMAIVPEEAETIRRIFRAYAGGVTARDIAAELNREGVPGPRGGTWSASTVNGDSTRGNGILRTELYAGVKVWNRVTMRKDNATGKRLPIKKPPSEWKRAPAEALRIVDAALWDQVGARQAKTGGTAAGARAYANTRKPGLFTGLLKCGCCGFNYTIYTTDRLICAGFRERGTAVCTNRRTLSRAQVEARVLTGLRTQLLQPEAVAAYVRIYHAEWMKLAAGRADRRRPLERRIAELTRTEGRYVDAVESGLATRAMLERARAAETERDVLEAQLAALTAEDAEPAITLHPNAADRYAALIGQLQAGLAGLAEDPASASAAREARDAIRALIIKITLTPQSDAAGAPVDISLTGDLARFVDQGEQASNGVVGPCGSWGRDRTADLWVMKPLIMQPSVTRTNRLNL